VEKLPSDDEKPFYFNKIRGHSANWRKLADGKHPRNGANEAN
jgi:hypothetical protein